MGATVCCNSKAPINQTDEHGLRMLESLPDDPEAIRDYLMQIQKKRSLKIESMLSDSASMMTTFESPDVKAFKK